MRASDRPSARAVLDNQVVHYRLAELKTEVEALRALVYLATKNTSAAPT